MRKHRDKNSLLKEGEIQNIQQFQVAEYSWKIRARILNLAYLLRDKA